MNDTITAVPGVTVGHWSDSDSLTGCTVVVLPEPNVVAVEVRGAAPGSRETALLELGMRVEQVQAILLTGGNVFGLAAADGVVRALEADGRGHETPVPEFRSCRPRWCLTSFPVIRARISTCLAPWGTVV